MAILSTISRELTWLQNTLQFYKKHFLALLSLGLVAALGRVIQLGAFGDITTSFHVLLEVIIESARLLLFVYVLGLANVKKGASRIKHLFTQKENRKQSWRSALRRFRQQWPSILLNLTVFSGIAYSINYLIDLVAYETCLFLTLKQDGLIANTASEWTILLFFKNLSVIPFTLTFEAIFLLWITDKLQRTPAID